MIKKEFKEEDIISLFIPKKSIQDNLLATAACSMIVGSIVLIGIAPTLSQPVRFSLATAVGSLTVSLFLLLWFNPRLEARSVLMKNVIERRVAKVKEDVKKFTKLFYTPLFKANLVNNLNKLKSEKINSKEEFDQVIKKAFDLATKDTKASAESENFTIEMFYKDFIKDMYFMDKKIFHEPLDENYSKFRHFLDIFSFKFRYHFFVVGVVALTFSIITHLLLK